MTQRTTARRRPRARRRLPHPPASFRLSDPEQGRHAFAHSIAVGLRQSPRRLSCRYLYDDEGSRLFDRITAQPEYYLTDAETEILAAHADGIRAAATGGPLVELGSGTARKTRHLLDAWTRAEPRTTYLPVDICPSVLAESASALRRDYPELEVRGIAGSYEQALGRLRGLSPLTLAFLGSSIGNFEDAEVDAFLTRLQAALEPGDCFLLGVDLVKDAALLEAAYNDAAGVTAAFTRNLFARMNRELGTELDLDEIHHVAYYNAHRQRIEIFARFTREAAISLPGLDEHFRIAPGEMIRTEIARKFEIEDLRRRLAAHGLGLEREFVDGERRFAVLLFRRSGPTAPRAAGHRGLRLLDEMRARTRDLIYPLTERQLRRQHSPLQSPIVWDLGHIANFEEQWVGRIATAEDPLGGERRDRDQLYDAIRHPRSTRGDLLLPRREECLAYLAAVRRRTKAALAARPLSGDPLLVGERLATLFAQHEAQHTETILQTIQLIDDLVYEPHLRVEPDALVPTARPSGPDMVTVPAGSFLVGTDDLERAYDNERPAHVVEVGRFRIDTTPVSNERFLAFLADGGYRRRELWTDAGWAWLQQAKVEHPAHWRRGAEGAWYERSFGRLLPLDPRRPVMHVCWYEADAFARWAGKRLPTEAEWEKAAACDLERGVARLYPWGDAPPTASRANLDQRLFAPAPLGTYADGRSFFGCEQMLGDVWEWTASEFLPYPGFRAYPYREYSEVHFGKGYRVLRGGSWATRPIAARNTFRNWDLPERRQIFAGFRCAQDA